MLNWIKKNNNNIFFSFLSVLLIKNECFDLLAERIDSLDEPSTSVLKIYRFQKNDSQLKLSEKKNQKAHS